MYTCFLVKFSNGFIAGWKICGYKGEQAKMSSPSKRRDTDVMKLWVSDYHFHLYCSNVFHLSHRCHYYYSLFCVSFNGAGLEVLYYKLLNELPIGFEVLYFKLLNTIGDVYYKIFNFLKNYTFICTTADIFKENIDVKIKACFLLYYISDYYL